MFKVRGPAGTNYLKAICAILHQEGSIAEVVSDFEYEKARNNGMPGERIIFNGPWKSEAALARAVEEGAMIQVDHRDEMLALMRLGHERGEAVPVALRVHLDTGMARKPDSAAPWQDTARRRPPAVARSVITSPRWWSMPG